MLPVTGLMHAELLMMRASASATGSDVALPDLDADQTLIELPGVLFTRGQIEGLVQRPRLYRGVDARSAAREQDMEALVCPRCSHPSAAPEIHAFSG